MRATLRYPFGGDRRLDAVLVGGGLHLLAVWLPLLPFIAVAGYLARVLAATAAAGGVREATVPSWRPIRSLLADGARLLLAAAAYLVVPVALLVVTLGGPLERVDPTGATDGVFFLTGVTVVTMLAFAAVYPLPAALVAVATDRSLRAAFDRERVGRAARDAGYLVATLFAAAALALAAGLYGTLNAVALGFFVAFYVEVVVAAALGAATGRAWSADDARAAL